MNATQGNGVFPIKTPPMEEYRARLSADSRSDGGATRRQPSLACILPDDCRRILIVGAGGFGREVFQWFRDAWPERLSLIAGFLSDDETRLDGYRSPASIIGSTTGYQPRMDEYLLLAIGVPYTRRQVAESLRSRGARFLTLAHPSALVADSAIIGAGSVICPYAVVSDSASTGCCVLVNYHASLGHDSSAGDYAVLSPYATLGGAARIADEVFLGLHASVGPGITVGSRSKVSANSCALANVPSDSIAYGVPGRIAPRLGTPPG